MIVHSFAVSSFLHLCILLFFSLSILHQCDARHLPQINLPTSLIRKIGGSSGSRGSGSGSGKKVPRIPKPCKKCGSGGDNDNEDDVNVDSEEEECFPSSAMVTISDVLRLPMSSLSVGDKVHTAHGSTSTVYTFSHAMPNVMARFLTFSTHMGNLSVTPGHYIYTGDSHLKLASRVRVGDSLWHEQGGWVNINSIQLNTQRGLYNPHTFQNELIVDGFRVSSYTKAVPPNTANGLLAPLKAFYKITKADFFSQILQNGCPENILPVCRLARTIGGSQNILRIGSRTIV